jgi:YD repeat-containing protein
MVRFIRQPRILFNARDQVTLTSEWAGAENGGGAYQGTTMAYDGHGRLQAKHETEQNSGTATVYAYNADDTIQSVTDARGASATYTYNNNRHLVNTIAYSAPGGITPTSNVSYGYEVDEGRGILPAERVNFRNCLAGPAKTGRKSLGMSVAQWLVNASSGLFQAGAIERLT